MSTREVTLETARFLDSAPARTTGLTPDRLRRVAEAFFAACYEGLGKKPRLLEDHDLLELARVHLPTSFGPGHDLIPHVPGVLAALIEHLDQDQVLPHAFELRQALEPAGEAFLAAAREGGRAVRSSDPVVHRAPKLGRNDPCFCGSGRKFKKCCGKES